MAEPEQRTRPLGAAKDSLVFAVVASTIAVGYLSHGVAEVHVSPLLLLLPLLAVSLAAGIGYLSRNFVLAVCLGSLPIYGYGIGEVVGAPYGESILVGSANLLLLLSLWTLPLTAVGFLLGTSIRSRQWLREHVRWLAVRISATGVVWLCIYVAYRADVIAFGVTV